MFKPIFQYFVYSNIWISIGGLGILSLFSNLFQINVPVNYFWFLFFATLFTYNFQRLIKIHRNEKSISGDRFDWINEHYLFIVIISSLSIILSIYFGWEFIWNFEVIWLFILIGFLSFFYVVQLPFLKTNLRNIRSIKIYLIAIVWTLMTVVLPNIQFNNGLINFEISLFIIAILLLMISITIPFDIRDINVDEVDKKTIPQLIGINKARYLSIVLWVISMSTLLFIGKVHILLILIYAFLGLFLLWNSIEKRKDWYYSFAIDGLLVSLLIFEISYLFE